MIGFYIFKYTMYLFVFSCIGFAGYINGKIIETCILFLCYVALRFLTPKTFHSKSFYKCIFLSIMMFWLAIPATLSLDVSLLSSILIGCTLSLILYFIQDYLDYKTDEIKRKSFNVLLCSKDELERRCVAKGFNEQDTKQCLIIFKSGLKGEDLYKALCYCPRQVKYLKKKYKEQLEK